MVKIVAMLFIIDASDETMAAIKGGKDQPGYPGGQQFHHFRIGAVGRGQVWHQQDGGDTRQHDQHRHQQFEKRGEQYAFLPSRASLAARARWMMY